MASITQIGKRWRALVRKAGHAHCKTFSTQKLAAEWAKSIESEIDELRATGRTQPRDKTIADLIDRYEREVYPIKPWGRSKTADLRRLKSGLGHIRAADLNHQHLHDYFADMRTNGAVSGVGIGSQAGYLVSVLETASNVWRLAVPVQTARDTRNGLLRLGVIKKSKVRDRRVSDQEIERIATHLERKVSALPLRDILEFCVASAMRISEVCRLRWEDLNETDRTITIRDRKHPSAKIGNHQIVPLLKVGNRDAFAIVKRQKRRDKRIFPANEKTVGSYFTEAVQQLEIPDLHLHDLRHEGISRLFEAGYRIEEVSLVSGHRDWSMLKRYTHLKPASLHRAAT